MIDVSFNTGVRELLNKYGIWIVIGATISLIVSVAITDCKWLYLGIVLIPFFLCLSLEKPFIFPFGVYAFLIPFDSVASITGNAEGTTLTKLLGILSICVLAIKGSLEKKLNKPDASAVWWASFVAYGTLSISWSIEPELGMKGIPTALGLLVLYLLTVSYKIDRSEFEMVKKCIFAGGVLASVFAAYPYLAGSSLGETAKRATLTLGDRFTNPNALAFDLLMPAAIAIEMILKQKKMMSKSFYWMALTTMVFCLLITGSRGGLLGLGTIVIVYIISIKQRVTFGIMTVIVGVAALSILSDYFIERIIGTIETGGEGRLGIWAIGVKSLESYWFLGAGLNNFPVAYSEFANFGHSTRAIYRAAHNTYLCFFVELGIFGLFLMLVGMFKHYKAIHLQLRRQNLDMVMLKGTFWATVVVSFVGDKVWDKSFWLLLMMMLMFRNSSKWTACN